MNENKDILKSEEVQAMSNQFAERLQKEEKANEVYETFLKSCGLATFEFEPFELEGETYEACKLGEGKVELKAEDYPDYYGGAYINDDGDLVVHVVGELAPCQAKVEKIIQHTDGYIVKQARYSYKELLGLKEYLDELEMNEEQKEVCANITGYGPSDKDNLFLVEMNVLDEAHIAAFKKHISDSEMVMFRQGSFDVEETTIRPGRGITRNNTNAGSSLSFRATRNVAAGHQGPPTPGFVISGHAARNAGGNGNQFRLNGTNTTIIGTVAAWQVSGGTDAAFCSRRNGITLSNLIHQNGRVLNSATNVAPQGATVWLAGRNNLSSVRRGEVLNANFTSNPSNLVRLTGARANYSSSAGDSGGLIYRSLTVGRRVVGVHARGGGFYTLIAPIMRDLRLNLW